MRSVEPQALKADTLASEFAQIMALLLNLLPGGLSPTQTLLQVHFPVLCTADVLQVISKEDWLTTINIKDIYFHVPITPHHKPGIPVLAAPFPALTASVTLPGALWNY